MSQEEQVPDTIPVAPPRTTFLCIAHPRHCRSWLRPAAHQLEPDIGALATRRARPLTLGHDDG